MKGLIIDEPHMSNILNGLKDWEVRKKLFPYQINESTVKPKISKVTMLKLNAYMRTMNGL